MTVFKTESNDDRVDLLIKFKEGEPMLDSKNVFLGTCVNKLTDFDKGWSEETSRMIKDAGAKEIARNKSNEMSRMEMYGYRKVFTKEFGTSEQLLTKTIDGSSLQWINVEMQNYNFEKVEKQDVNIDNTKKISSKYKR